MAMKILSGRTTGSAVRPAARPALSMTRPRRAAQLVLHATETKPVASTSSPQVSAQATDLVPDTEFCITKVSYGSILVPVGVSLLSYGFGAFFQLLPGGDVSSLMLIYGFPISVLGFALSYAQLEPVPCKTTRAAFNLRDSQMTDIQKQVREDVTRFRYGDEQHLETALDKIFRLGRSGGVQRKNCPTLIGLREEVSAEGMYQLVLQFKSKLDVSEWETRQPKIQAFFGPGIVANLNPVEGGMEVALVSDGSGQGRGGESQKDLLPPLMPGMPGRKQN